MQPSAILGAMNAVQQGQRGALMPWAAVALGFGVAVYFWVPVEPGPLAYGVAVTLALAGLGLAIWRTEAFAPLGLIVALGALGFGATGWRAHDVAGPVMQFRYYGPIEGRIVGIDRSASDALRLTLDQVRLDDVRDVPDRVRVSLHGEQGYLDPVPGSIVILTGHLSPPGGAAEPGGFDFQRHAWFQRLGGVGYTRVPALLLAEPDPSETRIFRMRMRMSAAIQAQIPGQPGAFAAAVLVGDRSGLEQGPVQDMRDANIAHLLAISGLHMGLLTGFVYGALRLVLALIPALALRYPIRKWAAMTALVAGAFYLAMSGGNVSTERAFIQVAVMFVAVLLDRRAITLRSVAIAAIIVLLHRPETLLSPGFQMSFAATTALVAVFNAFRGAVWLRGWPGWARGLWALVVSSVVAGAATAPFAAAHFNRLAAYGLPANLLTVPVMGSVVVPFAVVALFLAPFGLSWMAFAVMDQALQWILGVAALVAELPGAIRHVPTPPFAVLPLITLGGLGLCLWQGRGRWAALMPVLAALVLWQGATRPPVLISESGGLVGQVTEDGRVLSRPRGDGFVAGIWLENDGDFADQDIAAARPGWVDVPEGGRLAELGPLTLWHGTGRGAADRAAEACRRHDIVVLNTWPDAAPDRLLAAEAATMARVNAPAPAPGAALATGGPADCLIFSPLVLQRTGAVALSWQGDDLRIETVRAVQGARLWSQ